MITLSAKQLEKYLKEYELHLKYWEPNDGDGNELLGCRELLEQGYSQLSAEEKITLSTLDKQAQKLLSNYKGTKEFDIHMLEKVTLIAQSHISRAA